MFRACESPCSAAATQDGGKVRVAASVGSSLASGAIALLEAEGAEGLAASGPADWQVVQPSSSIKVRALGLAGLRGVHLRLRCCRVPPSIGGHPPLRAACPPPRVCAPDSCTALHGAYRTQVDPGYLSEPAAVEFATEGGRTAFMNYYAPRNKVPLGSGTASSAYCLLYRYVPLCAVCPAPNPLPSSPTTTRAAQDYALPAGALPPLLVKIHGGPTSQASTAFNLGLQYWTSRGEGGAVCVCVEVGAGAGLVVWIWGDPPSAYCSPCQLLFQLLYPTTLTRQALLWLTSTTAGRRATAGLSASGWRGSGGWWMWTTAATRRATWRSRWAALGSAGWSMCWVCGRVQGACISWPSGRCIATGFAIFQMHSTHAGPRRSPPPVHRRRQRGRLHNPGLPGLQVMHAVRPSGQGAAAGLHGAAGASSWPVRPALLTAWLALPAGTCLRREPATTAWQTPSCWRGVSRVGKRGWCPWQEPPKLRMGFVAAELPGPSLQPPPCLQTPTSLSLATWTA